MNKIIISLIIPIYNVEQYLERCLESVVCQMDENLEVILVDDGSPDNCPKICDSYEKKYNNFKVIHKKNGGLADAIKVGTTNSTGNYIAYVDSDDWLENDWYKSIKSTLKKYPSIDTIMYGFHIIKNNIEEHNDIFSALNDGYYDEISINDVKKLYMRPTGVGPTRWNKVYSRRIALRCLEYYDTRISIGEDLVFSAIATDLMTSTYIIKRGLMNYYINDGSMTQHFNEKYFISFDYLYRALQKYFGDNSMLYYINYINMRTMVNQIGKSDFKNKISYLTSILKSIDVQSRLQKVNYKELNFSNRMFLTLMLRCRPRLLLLISFIYRFVH